MMQLQPALLGKTIYIISPASRVMLTPMNLKVPAYML